jgi:hypothetical protein
MVILCKLNFKHYSESPHLSPMFKDLVTASKCQGSNRKRESLKSLLKEIADHPNDPSSRVVKPNGFVFHESRVGSTLVANFMASDPYAMVFSESTPMASAILHCESCSHEYNVQLFRDVTTLMGRSPFHKYLFFKFQSITVTNMNIALEVWRGLTRSRFLPRLISRTSLLSRTGLPRRAVGVRVPAARADDDVAPGPRQGEPGQRALHAQQAPPPSGCKLHRPSWAVTRCGVRFSQLIRILPSLLTFQVKDAIDKYSSGWNAPNEAWYGYKSCIFLPCTTDHLITRAVFYYCRCAAHLNMLCNYAVRNFEKYGTRVDPVSKELVQRGLLINYDSLPGYVPQVLLPLFGIDPLPAAWLLKLTEESNFYSKSRGTKLRTFKSDSEDKDSRATEAIENFADKILAPTYKVLEEKALQGLNSVAPTIIDAVLQKRSLQREQWNWKLLSPLPTVEELLGGGSAGSAENSGAASVAGEGSGVKSAGAAEVLPTQLRGVGHSTVLKEKEFVPWAPFANHHSSRAFQVRYFLRCSHFG